jgi:hypothetical protein
MRRGLTKKILLAILITALIGGLLFDQKNTHRDAIATALREGRIGSISDDLRNALSIFSTELLSAAGMGERIAFNVAPTGTNLDIVAVSSESARLTYCARANAIYDQALDCIFIDKELLTNGLPTAEHPWNTRSCYLALVLLHEFGHRTLHRSKGGVFDISTASSLATRRELEADTFAINALVKFYRVDIAGGAQLVGLKHRETITPFETPLRDEDRVWEDVASMATEIPDEWLRSGDSFSPFYTDAAHPMIVQRLARMIDAVAITEIQHPDLRAYFNITHQILGRFEEAGRHNACRIVIPDDIGGTMVRGSSLYLVSRTGNIYSVPLREVNRTITGSRYLTVVPDPLDTIRGPLDAQDIIDVWGLKDGGFGLCDRHSGSIFEFHHGKWLKRKICDRMAPQISFLRKRVFVDNGEASSSGDVCLLAGDEFEGFTLYGVSTDQVFKRSKEDLSNEVALKMGLHHCRIEFGNVIKDQCCVAVFDGSEDAAMAQHFKGIAWFSIPRLEVVKVETPIGLGKNFVEPIEGIVGIRIPNGDRALYAVGNDFAHKTMRWAVWRLTQDSAPMKIGGAAFLADAIRDPLGQPAERLGPLARGYDSKLHEVSAWEPNRLIVNFIGDSIFLINISERAVKTIGYPGGGTLKAIDGNTLLFFPSAQSHCCYAISDSNK